MRCFLKISSGDQAGKSIPYLKKRKKLFDFDTQLLIL